MSTRTDTFDLDRPAPHLLGEGRKFDLTVAIDQFELGQDTYSVQPAAIPVELQISRRTTGTGALR